MSEKILSQQDFEANKVERESRAAKFDEWAQKHKSGCAYTDSPMCRACIQEYKEAYINGELDVKETAEQKINREIAGKPEPETDMFPVECQGDLRRGIGRIEEGMTDEQLAVAGMFNPVVWFKHELGIELRWYQEDAVCCTARMKALRWGRRCLPAGEPVLMADGSTRAIEDVAVGDKVVSFDNLGTRVRLVTDTMENGVRDIYEITLRDGRRIRCTDNHPLLKHFDEVAERQHRSSGEISLENTYWSTLEGDLGESDQVVVLNKYDTFGPESKVDEAKFLGYMLTDGYINTNGQTPKFTSCDRHYIIEMNLLCRRLFGFDGNERPRPDTRAIDLYLTDSNRGTRSPVIQYFNDLGITDPKYKHRRIMDIVGQLDKESMAAFLNRAWAGDGCISLWDAKKRMKYGKRVECSLTSSDYGMIKALQTILYKIGVTAKISDQHRKSPNSDYVGHYWKIYFADAHSVINFLNFTGPIYGKEENSLAALTELQKRELVHSKTNLTGDYYTCRIKSIEHIGREPTYDITVDKAHNFIVNGIVVHNSGKTHSQVGRLLHRMQLARLNELEIEASERVLVLAPYQPQVDEVFEKMDELVTNSSTLCDSENRRTKSPNQIYRLGNNSQAKGFCTGSKTGSKSDKTRGQGATIIYMDEVDYIPDSDIESTVAIIADSKDTELWVTSTPSGKRGKFYGFCTDKRQGFKHFHVSAKASPEWTEKTEKLLRAQYSRAAWEHEIEAEFGSVEGGVFPTNKLVDSLYTYKYGVNRYDKNNIYAIGVDWNGAANGIPIIAVEFNRESNRYVVVDKKTSMSDEFTQLTAIEDIISMFEKWHADCVYLDAGYGNAQFEMLRAYAQQSNNRKLLKAVKAIHMHGKTAIRDPVTKKKIEKQNKSLMIDLAVRRVENNMCAFPSFENEEGGLVDQLRNLEIERYTPTGIPVYSQGKDHEAIAWLLAVFGITMEFSDIAKVSSGGHIAFMPFKRAPDENPSQFSQMKDTLTAAPRKEPDDPSRDFTKGLKQFHVMGRTRESRDKRGVTFGERSKFVRSISSGRGRRSF